MEASVCSSIMTDAFKFNSFISSHSHLFIFSNECEKKNNRAQKHHISKYTRLQESDK